MTAKKILLVDDDPLALKSLRRELEQEKFLVETADSGESALLLLENDGFDLAITDLLMGGMDGIAFLQEAQRRQPGLAVFVLTGHGDVESAIEAMRRGADDYLLKPCDLDELKLRIARCFEKQEALRQVKLYEKVRHLSLRLIGVVEEEHKRLAQSLQDELGELLPSLRYRLEDLSGNGAEQAAIGNLLDQIGKIVRQTSNQLRPDTLDTLGFQPTLAWCVDDFGRHHQGTSPTFLAVGSPCKLRAEHEIALFRVLREALDNVAHHAAAQEVVVRLIFSYPSVILEIKDSGVGFSPESAPEGLGLRGMRERMAGIGGTLTIHSRQPGGTTIRAEVGCEPN